MVTLRMFEKGWFTLKTKKVSTTSLSKALAGYSKVLVCIIVGLLLTVTIPITQLKDHKIENYSKNSKKIYL